MNLCVSFCSCFSSEYMWCCCCVKVITLSSIALQHLDIQGTNGTARTHSYCIRCEFCSSQLLLQCFLLLGFWIRRMKAVGHVGKRDIEVDVWLLQIHLCTLSCNNYGPHGVKCCIRLCCVLSAFIHTTLNPKEWFSVGLYDPNTTTNGLCPFLVQLRSKGITVPPTAVEIRHVGLIRQWPC